MMWFTNSISSTEPNELIRQCVAYITRPGDKPELEAVILKILETLREHRSLIEAQTYECVFQTNNNSIIGYALMNAPLSAIEKRVMSGSLNQNDMPYIIHNKHVTRHILERLLDITDDSERGKANEEIIRIRLKYC